MPQGVFGVAVVVGVQLWFSGKAKQGSVCPTKVCVHLQLRVKDAVELNGVRSSAELGVLTY